MQRQGIKRTYPKLPRAPFWLGHLPEMQRDAYSFYLHYHGQHGRHLRFNAIPSISFYSFSDFEAYDHILVGSRGKYSRGDRWRKVVGYLGGNGLVTSDGRYWQQQRRRMAPFFHNRIVQDYVAAITRNTMAVVERWKELPGGTEINVSEDMMYLGLINVGDALFGYDIRGQATVFSNAMQTSFAQIQKYIADPFTLPKFFPTRRNREFNAAVKIADRIAYALIADKRQKDEPTLVGALIRSGDLSDRQLRDEIITLLMAGHDTTATTLAWAWYSLALHPNILHNLQSELKQVLGGRLPAGADLEKLSYTRMVFEETLRLYPPVWALHRFAHADDEVMGYPVKKGSAIALPVYVTHRDSGYWLHPERFYPEHFSKEATAKRPRHAYLPFGTGERFCIGSQFALTEGILVLATLCQFVTPTVLGDDVDPIVAFTLKPNRPIMARF
jgi:cytochrome P450